MVTASQVTEAADERAVLLAGRSRNASTSTTSAIAAATSTVSAPTATSVRASRRFPVASSAISTTATTPVVHDDEEPAADRADEARQVDEPPVEVVGVRA